MDVLVVDDHEEMRQLVELLLRQAGHTVAGVADGREAFRELTHRPFQTLVTDVIMPGEDGLELIRKARKTFPLIRIVVMSGGGRYLRMQDCLGMAKHLGADATLAKPFTSEQLERALSGRAGG